MHSVFPYHILWEFLRSTLNYQMHSNFILYLPLVSSKVEKHLQTLPLCPTSLIHPLACPAVDINSLPYSKIHQVPGPDPSSMRLHSIARHFPFQFNLPGSKSMLLNPPTSWPLMTLSHLLQWSFLSLCFSYSPMWSKSWLWGSHSLTNAPSSSSKSLLTRPPIQLFWHQDNLLGVFLANPPPLAHL